MSISQNYVYKSEVIFRDTLTQTNTMSTKGNLTMSVFALPADTNSQNSIFGGGCSHTWIAPALSNVNFFVQDDT